MKIILIWFEKIFCKHKEKTILTINHQDGYVCEVCKNCGKVIYSDI